MGADVGKPPADRAWTSLDALSSHDHAGEPERFVDDRDALSYLYTSGTTSFPKGVVGTPLIGVQVAIMGPDGELLPPGEAGEIVYRGPSTMSGYLHDEDATDQAFAHGWFHSGDVGGGFKVPKAVIVVDQLPKTSAGKIQKNVVRSEHATHYEG